ncbi:DinB family protein [Flaviaesturariibacter amylovorans]|uniref:Damage-inducible protein DinB n=1 Tax=Flaviaesturariibacter amylovorans TaxID=1084520 RepID=A0ABP8H459_9BACT
MKELLLSYAGFNAWANGLLLDVLRPLPAELLDRELPSSFPSLRRTVLHLLDAESIWWQRLQLQERIVRPSETFEGDFDSLADALQSVDQQWLQWVQKANAHQLMHEFIYRDLRGQSQKSMVAYVLQHLINHGTYHRGQLVTLLRQVGVTTVPSTDFIAWTRKR